MIGGRIISVNSTFSYAEEMEVEELSAITKDDVTKFYKDYLNRKGAKRAKLTTYIIGKHIDDCNFACISLSGSSTEPSVLFQVHF